MILKKFCVIIFLSFFLSSTLHCSKNVFKERIVHTLFHVFEDNFYPINCGFLTIFQCIRGAALFTYNLALHDPNNQEERINNINQTFKMIESKLLQEEQTTIDALQKEFNINDISWKKCKQTINALKTYNKKAIRSALPNTYHAQEIPNDLMTTLTTILKTHDIHPNSLSILLSKTENKDRRLAEAGGTITYGMDAIEQTYAPQTIEFFPEFFTLRKAQQNAVCAHEVEHLVQQHHITTLVLEFYIKKCTSLSEEEIQNNPVYHYLNSIHEAQAEIFPALRNPEIAKNMTQLRLVSYYPEHLYEKHYYILSYIHMLWKIRKGLTYSKPYIAAFKNSCSQLMHTLKTYCSL